jgi:hypothetical protein
MVFSNRMLGTLFLARLARATHLPDREGLSALGS